MDLTNLEYDLMKFEYAAEILFRMCREHPEICPHDYHWSSTVIDKANGVEIKKYVCKLCGKELKEKVNSRR